ncbi:MAG: sulfur oxidation c-type cytochrome SoxA [Betaproteobacteria bacterium]|nr:sulfur oxidation c-type cytochrome SoxA [Betaproteobacteria bacterium]MDE2124169.1 sulfur oxidation c-type cytochrome SoxA [Betaproteobacteria bacterium]MDE2186376.1 sulfur oxidation c-type cytochrome SoxA [Betaproteobacteria bacterium]
MRLRLKRIAALAGLSLPAMMLIGACATTAQAESVTQEGNAYLKLMNEMGGNPADFNIDDGKKLWSEKRGPKNASLEQCNLGLGPGVVKGAYAQLPRYFPDTGKVQDLESRLVTCMETLQGFSAKEADKDPFAKEGGNASPLENIAMYVAHESDGMKIAIPQHDALEKLSYDNGKKLFFYRAGPFSFSCAACHAESGKRIKISALPNLTNKEAAVSYATWPAYPNSQGVARTLEWRMLACERQQRWPAPKFTSSAVIDLITYMGVNSNGATLHTPSFKR